MQVRGEGWGSIVLWNFDADLFIWPNSSSHILVEEFAIASSNTTKSQQSTALQVNGRETYCRAFFATSKYRILFRTLAGIASYYDHAAVCHLRLQFVQGVVRSTFATLLFYGSGDIPGTNIPTYLTGTNMNLGPLTDSVSVRDCLHWFLGGTGVVIGRGSEVRILGGRIIGPGIRTDASIGVHVTGNNGGVHVVETG
jgi:hypothetical protein